MDELASAVLSVAQSARMIHNTDARTFSTYERRGGCRLFSPYLARLKKLPFRGGRVSTVGVEARR